MTSFPSLPQNSPHSLLAGRWIWFGLQQFTQAQWERVCVQAATWHVQGLHPKVADGTNRWYDDNGLQMLKSVAQSHGLRVVPYHYCYGPRFGAAQISEEARISAWIGEVFEAAIPDIEDEYMGQDASADSFGQQVRALYHGLWMPTLYANPLDHPVPLLALNRYMDAWLPQVYFAEWNGNAQWAIDFVYPQWLAFDQLAKKQGQAGLKPILPIISLERNVAASQVADFMTKMHGYGYIGFWNDTTYAPYADTITNTPFPTGNEPPPVSPPSPPSPKPPTPPEPSKPLTFNDDDKQVWSLYKPIALNELAAIEQGWLRARYQHGWNFGPPLENEHSVTRNGKSYMEQQFTAARASYEVETGTLTWWTANGPVHG